MDPVEVLARAMTGGFERDDPPFRVCLDHNTPQAAEVYDHLYRAGYRITRDPGHERTVYMGHSNIGARLVYGYDLGYPTMSGHKLLPTFPASNEDEDDEGASTSLTVFPWYGDVTTEDGLGGAINTELRRIDGSPDWPAAELDDDPDTVLRDLGIAVICYGAECAGRALVTWQSEESDLNGLAAVVFETAERLRLVQQWDAKLADTLRWLRFTVADQPLPRWLLLPTSYA